MMSWEYFDRWIQDRGNNYINEFAVLINRVPGFVLIDSPWPGHGDALTLSIGILCTSLNELFELLQIETCDELEKIQPEYMLNLYYAGAAMVFCASKENEGLWFQKVDGRTFANLDGDEWLHEVQVPPLVPSDFFRYTEEYFRYIKMIKQQGIRNNASSERL